MLLFLSAGRDLNVFVGRRKGHTENTADRGNHGQIRTYNWGPTEMATREKKS